MNPVKHNHLSFKFHSIEEARAGKKWRREFDSRWPAYKDWFIRSNEAKRPTYLDSVSALRRYMPEFLPVYEDMVELAGGGDRAARFLAQYCPPPLFRGCSQAIYIKDEPVIVRNYDYSPYLCDGLVMHTRFDRRRVIAMTDCMTGVLDGINEDGLAISMAFGGCKEFGEGFSITLVLRYALEYCTSVAEVYELIHKIPVNSAYNIAIVDRHGDCGTVVVTPGREAKFSTAPVSTNHQAGSHWPEYAESVKTTQRFDYLQKVVANAQDSGDTFPGHFLEPPLFQSGYARGFGTIYTSAYYPCRGEAHYLWKGNRWCFSFDNFFETDCEQAFFDPQGFPGPETQRYEHPTQSRVPGLSF
jgi:predicted choloylglycine hydrolase